MKNYDLIVIGGGPGGYPLAVRMAKKGWSVALIEEDNVGGTCLNWGCIPSKALLASAKGFHFLKHASAFGLQCEKASFSWETILARKNDVVDKLKGGIEKLLAKHNVELVKGSARLFAGNIVKVPGANSWEGAGAKVCLAIGSKPAIPGFFPQNREFIWSSDEALFAPAVPERLLVIGAGVIGLELGQVFSEFGAKVTVIEMMSQILPGLDVATAKRLLPVFKKAGLDILLGKKVDRLEIVGKTVKAVFDGETREFDRVLVATGRKPNLSVFEGTGIQAALEGNFLKISPNFETTLPNVFAIGDCVPGPMLAHKASYDAYVLASQWLSTSLQADYGTVPCCVYTYPEVAWVGWSEEQAQAQGVAYKVGRSLFSANGKALAAGEPDGQIKTLVSEQGKLLGAVLWGPEVSNLIMEPTLVKRCGIDLHAFEQVIHPHPTLAEVFQESFENAFGEGVHG
jgi:dihydrolipoamide dehydrogenase